MHGTIYNSCRIRSSQLFLNNVEIFSNLAYHNFGGSDHLKLSVPYHVPRLIATGIPVLLIRALIIPKIDICVEFQLDKNRFQDFDFMRIYTCLLLWSYGWFPFYTANSITTSRLLIRNSNVSSPAWLLFFFFFR